MGLQKNILSCSVETVQWTPELARQISSSLEGSSTETVLRWGFENFAPSIVMATGFGPEGVVLMHLVSEIRPETIVFYLDTDLLFSHTYELRDELVKRLGIRFERVHSGISLPEQAFRHGDKLWERDPDTCCQIRKVIPQRQFLASYDAWITGIRRDQTAFRANTRLVEWDYANKMIKLNPWPPGRTTRSGNTSRLMICPTTPCTIMVIPALAAGRAPKPWNQDRTHVPAVGPAPRKQNVGFTCPRSRSNEHLLSGLHSDA